MNKKKLIISIIVLVVVIAAVFVIVKLASNNDNDVVNNDNNSQNNNIVLENQEPLTTYIEEEKTLDTLTFSDIKIVEKTANENMLVANVKNNSTERIESQIIDVTLYKENGIRIGTVGGILPDVEAEGTTILEIPIALGVMDTVDIVVDYAGKK